MKYQTDFEYKKEIQFTRMQEIEMDTVLENQKTIVVNIDDQPDFLKKRIGERIVSIAFEANVHEMMSRFISFEKTVAWDYLDLENAGFYIKLGTNETYQIELPDHSTASVSADALSISVNVLVFERWCHLLYTSTNFDTSSEKCHLYHYGLLYNLQGLKDFAQYHAESKSIFNIVNAYKECLEGNSL